MEAENWDEDGKEKMRQDCDGDGVLDTRQIGRFERACQQGCSGGTRYSVVILSLVAWVVPETQLGKFGTGFWGNDVRTQALSLHRGLQ